MDYPKAASIITVRRRDTIRPVLDRINEFPNLTTVVVESDPEPRYQGIGADVYINLPNERIFRRGRFLNRGISAVIKDVTHFLIWDADMLIERGSYDNIVNLSNMSDKNVIFPKISNYEIPSGRFFSHKSVFEDVGMYDEDMMAWGYEDTHIRRAIKNMNKYNTLIGIDCGEILHIESQKSVYFNPPGMGKWNTWEYNKIISDHILGIDTLNGPIFGNCPEPRGDFPKTWMLDGDIKI